MSVITAISLAVSIANGSSTELPVYSEADKVPSIKTGGNCLIRGGRVITVTHGTLESADVLIKEGKISAIGAHLNAPSGYQVIDATGKVVFPGIVDAHSHRGIDGTNEGTDAITSETRIGDVLNPKSSGLWTALASGQTTGLCLHGSANPIGGQSVVIKYKYNRPVDELPISYAPRMIKFALGENVTNMSDDNPQRFPKSRMGVEAVYRRAFAEAKRYKEVWAAYQANKGPNRNVAAPRRDLRLEALSDILDGKIWVQCHGYRADEHLMMARLSKEFGFKIGALQHALEAYKIAPELAAMGVPVSMFADSWGYKIEAFDGNPFNAAICIQAGVLVSVNTDSSNGTCALNQDAAKAMRYGGRSEEEAIKLLTINPAKELGIDAHTGSIDIGKDADIVIWDGHPLSVYSKPMMTLIDGEVFFERKDKFGVDATALKKIKLDKPSRSAERTLPRRSRAYVIQGATLHPISGPVIPNGTLVIEDGKITAIGKKAEIPKYATIVNASGYHVYPGLIDAGTSIGLNEVSGINTMGQQAELGETQPDIKAVTALQMESTEFGIARYNGITSVITRPTGGIVSGQAALVNTWGYTTEDCAVLPIAGLCVNFPSVMSSPPVGLDELCCGGMVSLHEYLGNAALLKHTEIKSLIELMPTYDALTPTVLAQEFRRQEVAGSVKALQTYFDKARDYMLKRAAEPGTPYSPQFEAMIPYLQGKKTVFLRARMRAPILAAIDFAQSNHLKAVIVGAMEAWKEAEALAKSRIPVILTPAGQTAINGNSPAMPYDPYDTNYCQPGVLERAGVKFCFQSDSNTMAMNLPYRVGSSCNYGLTYETALRSLTQWSAEILGVGDQLGSLEVGKTANLFINDGDPLDLSARVQWVFIEGQPVNMANHFTELRDKALSRLEPFEMQRFKMKEAARAR